MATTRKPYETALTDSEEQAFKDWKVKYAPADSGADYDLRGAFKAGITPDAKTGHWPDTFKKPNHPTFSPESIYHPQNPSSPLSAVPQTKPGTLGGRVLPGGQIETAQEAQARVLGLNTTSRQTPAQVADQANFDRSHGFTVNGEKPAYQQMMEQRAARLAKDPYDLPYAEETTGSFGSGTRPVVAADKASRARGDGTVLPPEVRRATVVAQATTPAAPTLSPSTSGNSAAVLSGIPKSPDFSVEPPASIGNFGANPINTDITSTAPAIARPPEPPSRAQVAGSNVRSFLTNLPSRFANAFRSQDASIVTDRPRTQPADTPIADVPGAIAGFTKGLMQDTPVTAAGASNAQVARIQQPTKENPVPVTDTTPVANPDENAMRKFSDVSDWTRRKMAFAGF